MPVSESERGTGGLIRTMTERTPQIISKTAVAPTVLVVIGGQKAQLPAERVAEPATTARFARV
jgi:hypothetical protein